MKCSKTFKHLYKMNSHIILEHVKPELKLKCGYCEKSNFKYLVPPDGFISEATLNQHILKLHTLLSEPKTCPKCEKVFYFKAEYNEHVYEKHQSHNPFACTDCPKHFISTHELNLHFSKEHKEEFEKTGCYTCLKCSKSFQHKYKLNCHMVKEHEEKKPFPCTECTTEFKTKGGLKTHVKTNHSKLEKPIDCIECGLPFYYKSEFIEHLTLNHKETNPNPCLQCDQVFDSQYMLQVWCFFLRLRFEYVD